MWFHISYDMLLKMDPQTGDQITSVQISLEANWRSFAIAQGSNGHDILLLVRVVACLPIAMLRLYLLVLL